MKTSIAKLASWAAFLLAIVCAIALALTLTVYFDLGMKEGPAVGLTLLTLSTALAALGAGAFFTGAIGGWLASRADMAAAERRSWIGILVGAAAGLIGFVLGGPFL